MSACDDPEMLVRRLLEAALRAGEAIMAVYAGEFDVGSKSDASPVTAADHAAEASILADLARIAPQTAVISEEAASLHGISDPGDRFFLVDPLDGTREFVRRNGEFTVNIALVEARRPVAGVVFAPAVRRLFAAMPGGGAFEIGLPDEGPPDLSARRAITVRSTPDTGLTVVASRSHSDDRIETILRDYVVAERRSAGSSLKFCLLACGEADLYPRTGRTMEWDTAAGQAILEAAGGSVVTFDGAPLRYGKMADGLANPGFVARGWK